MGGESEEADTNLELRVVQINRYREKERGIIFWGFVLFCFSVLLVLVCSFAVCLFVFLGVSLFFLFCFVGCCFFFGFFFFLGGLSLLSLLFFFLCYKLVKEGGNVRFSQSKVGAK